MIFKVKWSWYKGSSVLKISKLWNPKLEIFEILAFPSKNSEKMSFIFYLIDEFDMRRGLAYKWGMHLIHTIHKKFVLLALLASIALSLCPLDHLIPMAEASAHSEEALGECMPDVCATLESKKMVSHENTVQTKLLPTPVPGLISFESQSKTFRFGINGDSAPPPTLNKLYQIHATYLIWLFLPT